MTINLTQFLVDGFKSQQEYCEKAGIKGPLDNLTEKERQSAVIEHIGHLWEEACELRMLVPRRSWKVFEPYYLDSEEGKREFCFEMVDIILFYRAILAFSGISVEEFETYFNEKLHYNTQREDHKVNSVTSYQQLELQL